ncbi:MAG TPA: molybdate ABC transporter substrate-binding protein [Gemmatimonas aurantiaca]|uniref:Molybdenum ABC transporter periplasmic substrate binding protein n=2 Tax=Gemmatimonas aurantiaca TaxID=173480 RepID=C1ABP9_GEMAT|nr:molybdate ABC transporter substrate-binding protein [Gemmatimonas aurantiaca]BAH39926.1 molybdenum ABC transporter periplasmic substrate binding protein precursor [Gemmatimonas aurantiaca T-27]HCT58063.1 molybdate ABC transporter substrate-binding protein [Gemmatimonas aurantiaca]
MRSTSVVRIMQRMIIAGLVALTACTPRDQAAAAGTGTPLTVFAAADLRFALADVARLYREQGGDSLVLVFGSTGDLTTQIINGAPADVFFAANAEAIDSLAVRTMIVDSTRRVYAIGRLALIARCPTVQRVSQTSSAPCPAPARLEEVAAASVQSIAIADPAHAPYGRAARQTLERAGLWPAVEKRIVLGANVSQAYQFVSTGNADVGLVALSLVARDSVLGHTLVDASLHDPLRQTLAVLTASTHQASAAKFLAFLNTPAAKNAMHGFGFAEDAP